MMLIQTSIEGMKKSSKKTLGDINLVVEEKANDLGGIGFGRWVMYE